MMLKTMLELAEAKAVEEEEAEEVREKVEVEETVKKEAEKGTAVAKVEKEVAMEEVMEVVVMVEEVAMEVVAMVVMVEVMEVETAQSKLIFSFCTKTLSRYNYSSLRSCILPETPSRCRKCRHKTVPSSHPTNQRIG